MRSRVLIAAMAALGDGLSGRSWGVDATMRCPQPRDAVADPSRPGRAGPRGVDGKSRGVRGAGPRPAAAQVSGRVTVVAIPDAPPLSCVFLPCCLVPGGG